MIIGFVFSWNQSGERAQTAAAKFGKIPGFKPAHQQEDCLREDAGIKQPKEVCAHRVVQNLCMTPEAVDYKTPADLEGLRPNLVATEKITAGKWRADSCGISGGLLCSLR